MAVLKARIGGVWVPVGGGGGGGTSTSEVEINATDPIGLNPAAELWYDTDAVDTPVTTWLPLPYAASWAAGAAGAAYRKIGDIVYVQGVVQWSGGSVGSNTQTVCTLPVGYRPPAARRFVAWLNNTGVAVRSSAEASGLVTLDTALTTAYSWEINLMFSVTP